MVIDMRVTITYKCSACGTFDFFGISLFNLLFQKEHAFRCKCNQSGFSLVEENVGIYKIRIPCIACGGEHVYSIKRKDLLNKDVIAFHCPQKGLQQCFVGKDEHVRGKVDHVEKEFDALIDTFGYETYFKNTQVMFETVNKIHDIAEQGNLYCECGQSDVELALFSDKIKIGCKNCARHLIIPAASNIDLKKILQKQQISIDDEYSTCNSIGDKTLARKSNRK